MQEISDFEQRDFNLDECCHMLRQTNGITETWQFLAAKTILTHSTVLPAETVLDLLANPSLKTVFEFCVISAHEKQALAGIASGYGKQLCCKRCFRAYTSTRHSCLSSVSPRRQLDSHCNDPWLTLVRAESNFQRSRFKTLIQDNIASNPNIAVQAAKACLEYSRSDYLEWTKIGLAALSVLRDTDPDPALDLLAFSIEAGGIKYANDSNKLLLPQVTSSEFQKMYSDSLQGNYHPSNDQPAILSSLQCFSLNWDLRPLRCMRRVSLLAMPWLYRICKWCFRPLALIPLGQTLVLSTLV